ncbi:hypothetical protein C8J56DRAFT_1048941 [Mycena floridula]|nr:hypothetical protein C8J56DRAFT_1048941 [Mycena floridula]
MGRAPREKVLPHRVARMGTFNPSPLKRRNVKKTKTVATSTTRDLRIRQLDAEMEEMANRARARMAESLAELEEDSGESGDSEDDLAMVDDPDDGDFVQNQDTVMEEPRASSPRPDLLPSQFTLTEQQEGGPALAKLPRRTEPDEDSIQTYQRWQDLLPRLVPAFLWFQNSHSGQALPNGKTILQNQCSSGCKTRSVSRVKCLYQDSVFVHKVEHCACQDLFIVLVSNGLFPASPAAPRTAFSMGLLDMYRALFERTCDAINAMSSALQTFYQCRGFPTVNNKGTMLIDPFRRPLSSAVQWYDCLRVRVEDMAEEAIRESSIFIETQLSETKEREGKAERERETKQDASADGLTPGEADPFLQNLCPACFSGRLWGRSFQDGGDVHVSTDGNFHHKHYKSAGDTPPFFDPKHVLPKSYVDDIKEHVLKARRRSGRKAKLPDEAVDACEESHQAAKPDQKKGQPQFNDNGLMSLVCRHDIPLLFANIDTPGEGQHYPVALITRFASMLPPQATISGLYNLACVLDRSSELYELFPQHLAERLQFATTAMHAYAHQWSCQLIFNPRMRVGLAMTDGEGVERIWSALRQLISITRYSSRSCRIWLIDRLVQSTAANHRDTLSEWIRNKLIKIKEQSRDLETIIRNSGETEDEIRLQWEDQKAEQTSIRAQLEQVLILQGEIDTLEASIQSIRSSLIKGPDTRAALDHLRGLEEDQLKMKSRADQLYASLNVAEVYPELQGVALAFVQTLLLARDLKISLRKRVVGTFLEMDRLDQACGGANQALGTKAHQLSKKSIGKRAPALAHDIQKFNEYVETLTKLAKANPTCRIPIPSALPTTIKELRESSDINEDVWISKSPSTQVPRWLVEPELRKVIESRLRLDRCIEERRRLGREADNLCRWFGRRFAALELAIRCEKFTHLRPNLLLRRDHLLSLRLRWATPIVPVMHFDSRIASGTALALRPLPVNEDQWDELSDTESDMGIPANVPLMDILRALELDDDELAEQITVAEGRDRASVSSPIASGLVRPRARATAECTPAANQILPVVHAPQTARQRAPALSLASNRNQMPYLVVSISTGNLLALKSENMLSCFMTFSQSFFAPGRESGQKRAFYPNMNKGLVYNQISHELLSSSIMFFQITPALMLLSYPAISHPSPTPTLSGRQLAKASIGLAMHWVLYIVYVQTGKIQMFDSFGDRAALDEEAPRIVNLVRDLINFANVNGHPLLVPVESWTVEPLVNLSNVLQCNSFDCGVWVLAAMFAVLRGNETISGLSEKHMDTVRRCILTGILNLPSVA